MTQQTMPHAQINLCVDLCLRKPAVFVREQIEGEDHGPVGRVLERDHAVGHRAGLHRGEDGFYRGPGYECIFVLGEVGKSSL